MWQKHCGIFFLKKKKYFFVSGKASEFEQLATREEELEELEMLKVRYCHYPVKAGITNAEAKANILLQLYIGKQGFRIKRYTLVHDMLYIQQNASRSARAVFEVKTFLCFCLC